MMSIRGTLAILLWLALPVEAATLFVSPDGDGTDGQSWETAFHSIHQAIATSATGDAIVVGEGIYDSTSGEIFPLHSAHSISLLGDQSADPPQIQGDGTSSVLVFANIESATVAGFVIRGGSAEEGGGMRVRDADIVLMDCLFEENQADIGGGLSAFGSVASVTDCVFHENISNYASGGGLSIGFRSSIENTRVENNRGGGIHTGPGPVFIRRSSIVGNTLGYGITGSFSGLDLRECLILDNDGGGVFSFEHGANLSNCVVAYNRGVRGGGINTARAELKNCTLFGNTASEEGGAVYIQSTEMTLTNCIVWDNTPESFSVGQFVKFHVAYSNIEDLDAYTSGPVVLGEGNIRSDPMFVNPQLRDFRLERGSPCLETGTDTGLSIDLDQNPRPIGDYDMGAYEFPFLRSDLDGNGMVDRFDLLIFQSDWKRVSGN